MAAAAVDEVLGGDPAALVVGEVVNDRDHATAFLTQLLEAPAESQFRAVVAGGALAQDRVEPDLIG